MVFLLLGLGLGFGLEARHHTLRHVLALLCTVALACICWCCWRRNRLHLHRQRHDLHRQRHDLLLLHGPLSVSSAVSPGVSSAVSSSSLPAPPPPPPPPVLPPLPFRHFRPPVSSDAPSAVSSAVSSEPCDGDPQLVIKNSECPICLYAFETDVLLVVLPSCGHAYHPSCIHGWIQSHTDCPTCRAQIPHL